jgi:hypothetical protein
MGGGAGLALLGCDGGGGTIPQTANISGRVVDATDPDRGIDGATVSTEQPRSRVSTTTHDRGYYELTGVPAGTTKVFVTLPEDSNYQGVEIELTVTAGAEITLNITVVPKEVRPDVVEVTPGEVTVEVGQTQDFQAIVKDQAGHVLSVEPTWSVTGNIGTIDERGRFTATSSGEGTVVATAGDQSGTATVHVEADVNEPPIIASVQAQPERLGYRGGRVTVTAEVTDDKSVAQVWMVVKNPEGRPSSEIALIRQTGNVYQGIYDAAANVQEDGTSAVYTVTVYAKDNENSQARPKDTTFTVQGPVRPPGKPAM